MTNLRELSPPLWCYELNGDPAACDEAYVDYKIDGVVLADKCLYDNAEAKCMGTEGVFCADFAEGRSVLFDAPL